jgi:hypothetical protein
MNESKDIFWDLYFERLKQLGKLTSEEVQQLFLEGYINLNKLKGSKNLKCLFPNCSNVGVVKSHLFSEAFLRKISKKGKVISRSYYPTKINSKSNFSLEEIGINQAMTFPGFCKECEQKFNFEKKGLINLEDDYFLQLLRTVCYEKRILEIELENNYLTLQRVSEKSANKANIIHSTKKVNLLSITGINEIEQFLKERNKYLQKRLKETNHFYNEMVRIYNNLKPAIIYSVHLPVSIPIFAGYCGKLDVYFKSRNSNPRIIINIHPRGESETLIFWIDLKNVFDSVIFKSLKDDEINHFIFNIMRISNNWLSNSEFWDCEINESIQNFIFGKIST